MLIMKPKTGRPKSTTETVITRSISIKLSLWKKAQKRAEKLGISVSAYICALIEKDLTKNK